MASSPNRKAGATTNGGGPAGGGVPPSPAAAMNHPPEQKLNNTRPGQAAAHLQEQPPLVLKFKSEVIKKDVGTSADGAEANADGTEKSEMIEGIITKDAIILEQQLSNELRDLRSKGDDGKEVMQALGKSFDQVIQRDKNFGSLLTKIKKAYDEYLEKLAE